MRPIQPRSAARTCATQEIDHLYETQHPLAHKHRDPRYNSIHHDDMCWPAAAGSEAKRNSQIVERIDQLELEVNERL